MLSCSKVKPGEGSIAGLSAVKIAREYPFHMKSIGRRDYKGTSHVSGFSSVWDDARERTPGVISASSCTDKSAIYRAKAEPTTWSRKGAPLRRH